MNKSLLDTVDMLIGQINSIFKHRHWQGSEPIFPEIYNQKEEIRLARQRKIDEDDRRSMPPPPEDVWKIAVRRSLMPSIREILDEGDMCSYRQHARMHFLSSNYSEE